MKKCFIIAMCLCSTLAFARSPHHRGHHHHRGGDGGGTPRHRDGDDDDAYGTSEAPQAHT